jgi:hypothetical protein
MKTELGRRKEGRGGRKEGAGGRREGGKGWQEGRGRSRDEVEKVKG